MSDPAGFRHGLVTAERVALIHGVTAASRHGGAPAPAHGEPTLRPHVAPRAPLVAFGEPGADPAPPPSAVRRAVEDVTGVSVGDVRVHRGRAASAVTEPLGARAATVGGEVFVPDVAGQLTVGPGAALLAHELVHAGQQRRLGPTLADGAAAQRLERDAHHVERLVEGRIARSMRVDDLAGGDGTARTWPSALLGRDADRVPSTAPGGTDVAPSPPDSGVDDAAPARQWSPVADDRPDGRPPRDHRFPHPAAELAEQGEVATSPATITPSLPTAGPRHPFQHPASPDTSPSSSAPAPTAPRVAVQAASATPRSEPSDPRAELHELADRLYPSLRDRLRAELRLDRERAGRITDLRV